jgi:ABC-2 type transport system ATP-binding protein
MIDVHSLSRRYGATTAVDDVSFSISRRGIVGLLGHNGAGKTTVMKMLSGYLEPSAGSIRIDGHPMNTEARAVQRRLGYLPESLPVYPEMNVADYLDYAATLKGIGRGERARAMRSAIEATDLGTRLLDPIGKLSRGLRQRVGVAQALLGEPTLLILDEPTNGLDPGQTAHMRELIRELATRATVILSTHIMQEVDAVCEHVLMLSNGRLVLDSDLASLRHSHTLLLRAKAGEADLIELLDRLPQVQRVQRWNEGADPGSGESSTAQLALHLHQGTDMDTAAGNISRMVIEGGARLYALQPLRRDLETIFSEASQQPPAASSSAATASAVSPATQTPSASRPHGQQGGAHRD